MVPSPAPSTGLVSRALAWVGLAPSVSTAPAAPLQPQALLGWLSLAWQEVRRSLFNRTPSTAYDPAGNSQTVDDGGLVTAVTGDLGAVDADGDPLRFTVIQAPGDGSVRVNQDGTFVYTPGRELAAAGGDDRFVVEVEDVGVHLHGPFALFKRDFGRSTTATVDVAVVATCGGACHVNPLKVIATIDVGEVPNGVAFNPSGTRAYVANALDDTVSVINTATNTVIATVPVGDNPRGVAVNPPAGTRVYVTNLLDGTLSVINSANNTVITTIPPVGVSAERVAVSGGGTRVYVIGFQDWGKHAVGDQRRDQHRFLAGLPQRRRVRPGGEPPQAVASSSPPRSTGSM